MRRNRIRRSWAAAVLIALWCAPVLAGSTITTIAGTGAPGAGGDGGDATAAQLNGPSCVAIDDDGNIYIADSANHKIRRIDAATGVITTIAGTGSPGSSGDGGAATGATLKSPAGIDLDRDGNVYIADAGNNRIRMIDAASGVIDAVAGTGQVGASGDGGAATDAKLKSPACVALDDDGNIYIADRGNHKIRMIDAATGVIDTIAGTGNVGDSGDGGSATAAKLNAPGSVAIDADGNVCIADTGNDRVRRIDVATGLIETVAGTGQPGDLGDGSAATTAQLNGPAGVAFDPDGNICLADTGNNRIRMIDTVTGIITTFAGTGDPGDTGDGGSARSAQLKAPACLAITYDADAEITTYYVADEGNDKIRKIVSGGVTIVHWKEIDPID